MPTGLLPLFGDKDCTLTNVEFSLHEQRLIDRAAAELDVRMVLVQMWVECGRDREKMPGARAIVTEIRRRTGRRVTREFVRWRLRELLGCPKRAEASSAVSAD